MSTLKLSDLKVGDLLRSTLNQTVFRVTDVRNGVVIAQQHNSNITSSVWIKTTNLGSFRKVEDVGDQEPEPQRIRVREVYDIKPGHLAAMQLLAQRSANDPREIQKARSRGHDKPYWVSMEGMVRRNVDAINTTLTARLRDQLVKVVSEVKQRIARGDDPELCEAFHAASDEWPPSIARGKVAEPEEQKEKPRQRPPRFQQSTE